MQADSFDRPSTTTMRTSLLALLLVITSVHAQAPAAPGMARTVEDFLLAQTGTQAAQTSIEIGKLPDTERFAACKNWQAFLPPGAHAWGKVSVGLRCTAGGNFSLYVSARVRITGTYLAAAQPIAIGQVIRVEDIKPVQGELTAQAPDLLTREDQAIGQVARTSIGPDRPLQAILFRPETIIQAGQSVKVVSGGSGFAVSNEGQAMNGATSGQPIRVRLTNGNIVNGIARGKGLVEVQN